MKIYIDGLGPKPHVSVGSQALLNATIEIIGKKFPDSEYHFISNFPEVDELYIKQTGCRYVIHKRPQSPIKTFLKVRQIISQVSFVVSPWGDAYITNPPHFSIRKTLALKKRGTPFMLMTSSLGPFEGGWKGFVSKLSLRRFDVLTVRDIITFEYIKSLGIKDVKLFPDTAFVLRPSPRDRVLEIFNAEGIPFSPDNEYVGINVSILQYNLMKEQNTDYIYLLLELIDYIKSLTDLPVLLIPHQYYSDSFLEKIPEFKNKLSDSGGDDRYIFELISRLSPSLENVFPITGEYSCYDYKAIIGGSVIFIGCRMHSVIFSLSSSVPSVLIDYSHKSIGLMDMLGLKEYSCNIHSGKESLLNVVNLMWDNRIGYKSKLSQIMPDVISNTYSSIDLIDVHL